MFVISSFHPELRMRNYWFSIWKRAIFRPGKEIKELRGGVHQYAAQARPKIDAARAEKGRFRMKTIYITTIVCVGYNLMLLEDG